MRNLILACAACASTVHNVQPVYASTTVYLNHTGATVEAKDGHEAGTLPAYGGSDKQWQEIETCVRSQFQPFDVDIVTTKPAKGDYTTVVVGGYASDVGLDNAHYNGIGPYARGYVLHNATVLVFSKVGPRGEDDIENICSSIVHEAAHPFGLDHERYCGDIMSYDSNKCGARKFVDAEAPCGEHEDRACGNGAQKQNSYRLLARNIGLRNPKKPTVEEVPVPAIANGNKTDDQIAAWKSDSDKLLRERRARRGR